MAIREQNLLRERIVELEKSLKLAKSPGYAQVGAQFEQTLRLAESEAARLVNDAGRESLRLRDEAQAEVERIRAEHQQELDEKANQAANKIRTLLADANDNIAVLTSEAERQLQRSNKERMDLEKQANVIRSEAENYAANVKAQLQAEVEKIQNANSRLQKRNADLEAEIAQKLDEGEHQALEIFHRVQAEATATNEQAQRHLAAATLEAASLLTNAEETLESARKEADRIHNEANAVALNLLVDSRSRAEALSIRALDLTSDAIAEAEYALSKLPDQKLALENFLSESSNLLTPDQQLLLARRKSVTQGPQAAIEPELIEASEEQSD